MDGSGEWLTPFVVGAYGHSRADSLVRGVGEAVERFSLIGDGSTPTQVGTFDELAAEGALEFTAPGLGSPAARTAKLRWSPARWSDGEPCWVPTSLIDYPDDDACDDWFDSGPSGAASGLGVAAATRSALLEIIERDAFLVAWDCGIGLPLVDPRAVAAAAPRDGRERAAQRGLRTILAMCEALGLTVTVATIPTGVTGVVCATAVLVDPRGDGWGSVCVGCDADDALPVAVLGAVQESLQLRSVSRSMVDRTDDRVPGPADVRGENDRLRRLASPVGARDILDWASRFTPAPLPATGPVTLADLVAEVGADGCRLVHVDLTSRLPAPIATQGWATVKLIPVGYQHLRMDETFAWSWNGERRARVVARARSLGLDVARPDGAGPPHPLP